MPAHTVRRSTRARRVHLTVSPAEGLVVVVPARRVRMPDVARLLDEHRAWIDRNLRKIESRPRPAADPFPATVHLRALEEAWTVTYQPTRATGVAVRALPGNVLALRGNTTSAPAVARALTRWLQTRAEATLPSWAAALAHEVGFHPRELRVRGQRTIWGSCSRDGVLSLNRHLLFLPPALARCVLVHELCHLRYLSHGPRFWGLVARHVEDLATRRAELRSARRLLPAWTNG